MMFLVIGDDGSANDPAYGRGGDPKWAEKSAGVLGGGVAGFAIFALYAGGRGKRAEVDARTRPSAWGK